MDSYEKAKRKLDLITSESGWYVYCIEEEEWHLYNEEEELLFRASTIEELVEKEELTFNPSSNGKLTKPTKVPKLADQIPIKTDDPRFDDQNLRIRTTHADPKRDLE